MSKRKSAAVAALEFFQTATIESAREVLAICVNTVKVREGGTPKRAIKPRGLGDVRKEDMTSTVGVAR